MSSQPNPAFSVALDAEITGVERAILAQVAHEPVGPNDLKVAQLKALKNLREKYYSGTVADVDRAMAILRNGGTPEKAIQGTLLERHFTPASAIVGHTILRGPGRKQSPERQRALAAAREYLLEKTTPIKTSDIYKHLQSRNITIGGADPVNNLSAALAHASGFRSHGKAGWTL